MLGEFVTEGFIDRVLLIMNLYLSGISYPIVMRVSQTTMTRLLSRPFSVHNLPLCFVVSNREESIQHQF